MALRIRFVLKVAQSFSNFLSLDLGWHKFEIIVARIRRKMRAGLSKFEAGLKSMGVGIRRVLFCVLMAVGKGFQASFGY